MASTLSNRRPAATSAAAVDSTAASAAQDQPKKKISSSSSSSLFTRFPFSLFDGIGGTINGSFFQTPRWVDISLPPGTTSQEAMYAQFPQWLPMFTGKGLIYSPNLIWFVIALMIYFVFPYNMQAAKQWDDHSWILQRLYIHFIVVMSYFGFWHITLYSGLVTWAKRPFVPNRTYRWSKVLHNIWYALLAIIQWTIWEVIMIHLYATGRIGYQSDDVSFGGSFLGLVNFIASCILVPVNRDFHFFFSHRFIHNRFLYKYVHALHHRNTDVEPFAGLAMSPMEHLYYFSCAMGPSLYWYSATPFMFLWNGIHALLSPAAPHSGWEDHWQSQQFHAIHHRYFECNYGTPGIPFDRWFGTFRETMAPITKVYTGPANECQNNTKSDDDASAAAVKISARSDDKATLWGFPTWDVMIYNAITWIGIPWLIHYALARRDGSDGNAADTRAKLVALFASVGPILVGVILLLMTTSRFPTSLQRWRYTLFYPFHKESFFGTYGICLAASIVMVLLPVYHMVHALLVPDPNQTIYYSLWGP